MNNLRRIHLFSGDGYDPKTGHYWGFPPAGWVITGRYCKECGAVSDEPSGDKPCPGKRTTCGLRNPEDTRLAPSFYYVDGVAVSSTELFNMAREIDPSYCPPGSDDIGTPRGFVEIVRKAGHMVSGAPPDISLPEKWAIRLGLKPQPYGDQWSLVWGDNVQEGVCGFGASPVEAIEDFERAMNSRIEPIQRDPDDPRTDEDRRAGLAPEAITVVKNGQIVYPKVASVEPITGTTRLLIEVMAESAPTCDHEWVPVPEPVVYCSKCLSVQNSGR